MMVAGSVAKSLPHGSAEYRSGELTQTAHRAQGNTRWRFGIDNQPGGEYEVPRAYHAMHSVGPRLATGPV
jgi:hypothetical protein